jgi:hypothetical protein
LAFGVAALGLGAIGWRFLSVQEVPDVGEPFDMAAFSAEAPSPSENAYVLYEQALARFRPIPEPAGSLIGRRNARRALQVWESGWDVLGKDDATLLAWLDANREAAATWRSAAELDRAVDPKRLDPTRPSEVDKKGYLTAWYGLPAVAGCEAARLEARGDMRTAWAWHRAILRSFRHVGGDDPIDRMYSLELGTMPAVLAAIGRWAADHRTGTDLLRHALFDLAAIEAMPASEAITFKALYRDVMAQVESPSSTLARVAWQNERDPIGRSGILSQFPGAAHFRWFFRNEPERSRRVAHLIFANWLRYAQSAPTLRSTFRPRSLLISMGTEGLDRPLTLFEPTVSETETLARPDAGRIARWYASTALLKRVLPDVFAYATADPRARANRRQVEAILRQELQRREHAVRSEIAVQPRSL